MVSFWLRDADGLCAQGMVVVMQSVSTGYHAGLKNENVFKIYQFCFYKNLYKQLYL